MKNLDDVKAFTQLDPAGVLTSIGLYTKQCEQAWNESSVILMPEEYKHAQNIVVCGMGGSRFTPKTVMELFKDRISIPYTINEDYTLPAYVNENSLVILSSYSGTTEEVVICGKEAFKRGAKVCTIGLGGTLETITKEHNLPHYFFKETYNPCGQPRIGSGYMLFGHLGLLVSLGYLPLTLDEVTEAITFAQKVGPKYNENVLTKDNAAKQLALQLKEMHPFVITAEFLRGFGNGFANQINENAKMISDYRYISELNHHMLEGLKYPETLHQNGMFVFVESELYSLPIQKRFRITKDVVEKQQVKTLSIKLTGLSKLAQVLEAFTLSSYATFYLAALYGVDPVAIPWVDYFKAELAK